MSKRIGVSHSEQWESIFEEFRLAHPSRTWPDATILTFLAEIGYESWKRMRFEPSVAPVEVPMQARMPQAQRFVAPVSATSSQKPDDGFPFDGMLS